MKTITTAVFSQHIRQVHEDTGADLIDCILHTCETYEIDIAVVNSLLTNDLRREIEELARERKLLKTPVDTSQ